MTDTALQVVRRSELVKIGKKSRSLVGYRSSLVEEHLHWHLSQMSNKWCSVSCMARTIYGRNSEDNCDKIRKHGAAAFKYILLKSRRFLVIEYDDSTKGHGRIKAMKLYEGGDGGEGTHAQFQIDRMESRRQITEYMRQQALTIIGIVEP
jgi:hypothetical protein